jgi:hypothetical protein
MIENLNKSAQIRNLREARTLAMSYATRSHLRSRKKPISLSPTVNRERAGAVVAFNTAEGWSRDVTEDVGSEIVEARRTQRPAVV